MNGTTAWLTGCTAFAIPSLERHVFKLKRLALQHFDGA
jgi:hypothetical protein